MVLDGLEHCGTSKTLIWMQHCFASFSTFAFSTYPIIQVCKVVRYPALAHVQSWSPKGLPTPGIDCTCLNHHTGCGPHCHLLVVLFIFAKDLLGGFTEPDGSISETRLTVNCAMSNFRMKKHSCDNLSCQYLSGNANTKLPMVDVTRQVRFEKQLVRPI